jgi:hypothetical protein
MLHRFPQPRVVAKMSNDGLNESRVGRPTKYSGFKYEFMRRVREEWLPGYCNDPKRQYSLEGFQVGKDSLTEKDARDFLRAVDYHVVFNDSQQRLRMPRGKSLETLFV